MAVGQTVDEHLRVLVDGLTPRAGRPARVVVVGAGMAGLVAASELARAGHDPVVLEAQQRVGGRVLTLREPFAPGLWAEAGAMRLPRSHALTMALVDRYGLATKPFVMDNDQAYCFFGGQRCRRTDLLGDPHALGFEVSERERVPPAQLWEAELAPFRARLRDEGVDAWAAITSEYDQYAVREFLELREWTEGAIEMFGLLFNQEALMNSSFLEVLREELGDCYTNLEYLDGGSDLLPRAFMPELTDRIRFGAKMVALEQSDDTVTAHYKTGGGSVTDLAVRNVFYPDHGRDTGRGVLLASYTWGEDAQRWGSLSPEDRLLQALEDVGRIHPQAVEDYEVGASKMWHDDEFAGGAFALFDPQQQTLLYDAICAPEGRVHFAGEHASLAHAWIQGAIESGVRAASEIHELALATA